MLTETRAGDVLLLVLALANATCASLLLATDTDASGPRSHTRMDKFRMVGNLEPFPDLERAGKRNVRRAHRLKRASRRTAHRFETLAKARAHGYVARRVRRSGFVHARKHYAVSGVVCSTPRHPRRSSSGVRAAVAAR